MLLFPFELDPKEELGVTHKVSGQGSSQTFLKELFDSGGFAEEEQIIYKTNDMDRGKVRVKPSSEVTWFVCQGADVYAKEGCSEPFIKETGRPSKAIESAAKSPVSIRWREGTILWGTNHHIFIIWQDTIAKGIGDIGLFQCTAMGQC